MANADKRSVHTDALETLGTVLDEGEARDAIHLAVEPVVAGGTLGPGDHVGRYPNGRYGKGADKKLGIVDPFLDRTIYEGERFWLVIYPRVITSLRHVWAHPDFEVVADLPTAEPASADRVSASRRWIEDYAASLGGETHDWGNDGVRYEEVTADELIEFARSWVNPGEWGGDYLTKGGLLEGVGTDPRFWDHFEVVTGLRPKTTKYGETTPNFFSCSC